MSEFLTIIISVSLSGVVAVWLTYVLNSRKERRDLYRIKLEGIYISFNQWSKYCVGQFFYLRTLFRGQMTYDQYLDKIIEGGKLFDSLYPEKMKMMILFYYPSLRPKVDGVVDAINSINKLRDLFKQDYEGYAGNKVEYIREFEKLMEHLSTSIADVNKAIEKESKKL